ncbi:MAG: DUF411 domain-containing protein [Gemmatimonadota bacterium]|nr:MAG: DUF411 domain-containing protein [Gemmatimonadota bacterium]
MLVVSAVVAVGVCAAVVAQYARSGAADRASLGRQSGAQLEQLAAGGAVDAALSGVSDVTLQGGPLAQAAGTSPSITVYKSPMCGCCSKWVEHLEANGFAVTVIDTEEMSAIKSRYGVGPELESCHTGLVDGYVIEGHVPADLILKLLEERPSIAGIAVPGMPTGSPGMEVPSGQKDPYDVLAFDKDGNTKVYARR